MPSIKILPGSTCCSECPLPTVSADEILLVRLFQNLLANSIRYRTRKRPEIRIRSTRESRICWLFLFKDNGVGIDPRYAQDVFQPLRRFHDVGSDSAMGMGLGLAVAKKIVERHGGRIWVKSSPGQRSTFCFTLADA